MKPTTHCTLRLGLIVASLVSATVCCGQSEPNRQEFFEKKIRPALEKHCLACHSNATEVNGGLVLDSLPDWERGGDSGVAIQKGDPTASLLVRAIEYGDPHLQMPPDGPMPKRVIEDFRAWIRDGAYDPRKTSLPSGVQKGLSLERAHEHWAYHPMTSPEIPQGDAASTIDRFIDAKLTQQALVPQDKASKSVLLRRLKFDLHGLPPTSDELEAFEADGSDDAYETLVDELLNSPRYAERMARHWLDVVRFGESLTLRGFVMGNSWRYRDYLIQAFAEDRAWDEVLREQIAGDLIQTGDLESRQRQMIATTFWLMGNSNLEEQDKQQLEMDIIDEQLDTFGKAILGQTLGCARCHDHKFDPIPTRDYYALAGVLKASQVVKHANVSNWIEAPLPLDEEQRIYFDNLEADESKLKSRVDEIRKELAQLTKRKDPEVKPRDLLGIVVDDDKAKKIGSWQESTHTNAYVGRGYIHDANSNQGSKTVSFEPANLPPGVYEVRLAYATGKNRATNAKVIVYSADGDTPLAIDQSIPPPIDGLWISLGRYRFEKDGQAYVLISNEEANGHVIADAVQFIPESDSASTANQVAKAQTDTEISADESDRKKILQAELKSLEAEQKKVAAKLQHRPKTMAMLPVADAQDLPIHIRGDVHNLGQKVPRGTLQLVSIPSLVDRDDRTFDRLALSRWVVAVENPLTARVMTNRVWSWLMGEGLVRSLDNFGTTGEAPVHPELLDYLASRFVQNRWSVRGLVREIVLSDAYQRRSAGSVSEESVDPDNRYWWRGYRRRLDAETLRDSVLAISGQLEVTMYGSTIPVGLKSDYGYVHQSQRRSIYLPVLRNSMPSAFEVFDVADPSSVVGKRGRSTTASQALWMMNDAWLSTMAQHAAKRMLKESPEDASADTLLDRAGRMILGRSLTETERTILRRPLIPNEADQGRVDEDRFANVILALFQSMDFRFPE